MASVLEGATVLSVCKLVCSLPFLHSVVASTSSPVSFCCHCLLVFTDVILTIFFSCLLFLERWQAVEPFTGETITLRFLLFICHTYGTVFLFTLPEIIVDTQIRHLDQQRTKEHQNTNQKAPEEPEKRTLHYHIVAYLCCLSLWLFGTYNIRLRWQMEEFWTAACLYSNKSLLSCLPNIYSPMMRVLPPYWIMALLYIAMGIVICLCLCLTRVTPKKSVSQQEGDIGVTQRSSSVKINANVGLSLEYAEQTHKDHNSTEKVICLTFTEEREPERPQRGSSLRAEVMIGVVCVIAMFVLPLHLAVNIHLISALEKIVERSVKYFGSPRSVRAYMDMDMI